MKYFPMVFCAKCNEHVPRDQIFRLHDMSKDRRYVVVRCHGEKAETNFVDDPNDLVTLWSETSNAKEEK